MSTPPNEPASSLVEADTTPVEPDATPIEDDTTPVEPESPPAHSGPNPATAAPPTTPPRSPSANFGHVDADGTVWVATSDGPIRVGQYAAGSPEEGLAFYARKYDDLAVEADLALKRLRGSRSTPESAAAVAAKAREQLADPHIVGDLNALRATCDAIDAEIEIQRRKRSAERAAARAATLARREAIGAEAEQCATSTQWKATGERYRVLLDEWKTLPHGDRGAEQALWKRFSAARSAFDKARRVHFAKAQAERSAASAAKEAIIAEAEVLSTSTDWGATAAAFRTLVDRWKAAPRGPRREEDAWWNRFKKAQDTFFEARNAATSERDSILRDNLVAKEALLAEATALLPITDPTAASRSLRSIQQRWEAIGHVPRGDKERIEGGLRKVDEALKSAEGDRWRRTDPAKRAFAESTVEKFRESLAKQEKAHAAAVASGNDVAATKAADSIASTRSLLEAAERSLAEYS